jgi:DNA adenine methylase
MSALKAPFPWFGGKSAVAPLVWGRFGRVRNYVEPFGGSLAVLLGRPRPFEGTETVNDADGYVSNFWRALRADPDAVAFHADWPVFEVDVHARHAWLVGRKEPLRARLEGDPDFFDAKIAGWWVWGVSCWIGSGFCSGEGPWGVVEVDGVRQLAHLGDAGRGVNRQLAHLGDAGRGVNRKRAHLGNAGQGVNRKRAGLYEYLGELADRLRGVRVCSGDWSRVCGPTPTTKLGLTGVFLDPPYGEADGRSPRLYTAESLTVADDVREWAAERGEDPQIRIALCGYDSSTMPAGWTCESWKAKGGYGSQGEGRGRANAGRERVWFSPYCLRGLPLFEALNAGGTT